MLMFGLAMVQIASLLILMFKKSSLRGLFGLGVIICMFLILWLGMLTSHHDFQERSPRAREWSSRVREWDSAKATSENITREYTVTFGYLRPETITTTGAKATDSSVSEFSMSPSQTTANTFVREEQLNINEEKHFMQRLKQNLSINVVSSLPDPRRRQSATNQSGKGRKEFFDPLEKRYPLHPDFTFPQPKALRPIDEVMRAQWVRALRRRLSIMTSKQVTMVTSNSGYTDVLLNWLISAAVKGGIPLSTILVLSLDEGIHSLLQQRKIASVYLPLPDLLSPSAQFNRSFELVMVTRLSVMRLINHWGFDVANYDTDAIILKNPQPLYDSLNNSNIVGSIGTIPVDFYNEWGVTVCIGVVMFRSSRKTEEYWQAMTNTCLNSFDDQGNVNCGLKALNVKWSNADSDFLTTIVKGETDSRMKISVLPYNDICRLKLCELSRRERLYIWHKGGDRIGTDKMKYAREGRTWFIRDDWQYLQSTLTGVEWLRFIANEEAFR